MIHLPMKSNDNRNSGVNQSQPQNAHHTTNGIETKEEAMKANKSEKNVVQMGGNIDPLKKDIAAARDKVIALKAKRADINASIAEVRASMEAKGITKKAFDDALRYYESDADKREGYDNAYIIARESMGFPVRGAQLDMFEEGQDDADTQKATA